MGKIDIDGDLIRELARMLDETGLTEIEVADGDRHIRVARQPAAVAAAVSPARSRMPISEIGIDEEDVTPRSAPKETPPVDGAHPGAVTSPMVGTVYLGPEPEAPAFVGIGDQVSEGQTLFIVEAMKTMNPIRAPRTGTVTQIFVENGAPVEYGEVLLLLQ